jgi:hypothetical protein
VRTPMLSPTSETARFRAELPIQLALIAAIVTLAYVDAIPTIVTYVVLASLALRSPLWAFRALAAGVLASLLTSAITQEFIPLEYRDKIYETTDSGVLIGRYILLAAATLRIANEKRRFLRNRKFWLAYSLFAGVLIINSIAVSYQPLISLLKAATLLMGIFVLLQSVRLDNGQGYLETVVVALFGAIVSIGFPLAVVPSGYMVNGSGFQGLLNHPQVLGIVCGILGAFLFVRALRGGMDFILYWALLTVALVSLILSQARTGLLAFLVGSAIGTIRLLLSRQAGARAIPAFILAALIGTTALLTFPELVELLEKFINKRNLDSVNLGAMWQETRATVAEKSWQGFLASPILGWGFGLPWDSTDLVVKYDPFFNLPIGASVEKGLIFTASLEELGVFGAFFACLFLLWILSYSFMQSRPEGAAIVFAAVASNVGESTLFSFGGVGAFVWVAIAVGLSTGMRRV